MAGPSHGLSIRSYGAYIYIYIYIYLLPRYVVSMEFSAADSGVVDC